MTPGIKGGGEASPPTASVGQKEQFVPVVVDFYIIYQQEKPIPFLLERIN